MAGSSALMSSIKPLTSFNALRLFHCGAAEANREEDRGIVSIWSELTGSVIRKQADYLVIRFDDGTESYAKPQSIRYRKDDKVTVLRNLGGPRADELEAECSSYIHILERQDVFFAFNTMAWFRETKLKVNKSTGWPLWKRRGNVTRYLNAVAVDVDFHDREAAPTQEEMLASLNARYCELSLPEPNIVQFSGRGIWAFWLLADNNGNPGVRAWPLALRVEENSAGCRLSLALSAVSSCVRV